MHRAAEDVDGDGCLRFGEFLCAMTLAERRPEFIFQGVIRNDIGPVLCMHVIRRYTAIFKSLNPSGPC